MNEKKLEILHRLIKGDSITDISKECNVSRYTIYQYMKDDEFKEVREQLEKEIYDTMFHIGISEMKDILINGNNYQKIQVFQMLTKLQDRVIDKSEVTLSVDDLLRDLI